MSYKGFELEETGKDINVTTKELDEIRERQDKFTRTFSQSNVLRDDIQTLLSLVDSLRAENEKLKTELKSKDEVIEEDDIEELKNIIRSIAAEKRILTAQVKGLIKERDKYERLLEDGEGAKHDRTF